MAQLSNRICPLFFSPARFLLAHSPAASTHFWHRNQQYLRCNVHAEIMARACRGDFVCPLAKVCPDGIVVASGDGAGQVCMFVTNRVTICMKYRLPPVPHRGTGGVVLCQRTPPPAPLEHANLRKGERSAVPLSNPPHGSNFARWRYARFYFFLLSSFSL
jgi:hypothetical protein